MRQILFLFPLEKAEKLGEEFFSFMGVSSLEEARKLDASFVRSKYSEFRGVKNVMFCIVQDDKFCKGDAMKAFYSGDRVRVPVMAGNTGDEFIEGIKADDTDELRNKAIKYFGDNAEKFLGFDEAVKKSRCGYAAVSHPEIGVKSAFICESRLNEPRDCYYYRFIPDIPGDDNPGTFHSVDLWFFFDTIAKCTRPYTGRHYDLARQMSSYWINFIKTGDPNGNYKQDEIAADLIGVYEMRWLLPYFGIVADDSNLARQADGSLVFAPELPVYRDFISTLRDWVEKGILTKDAFTAMHSTAALSSSSDDEDAAVTSGLLVTMTPYTHVPSSAVTDYEALLMPDASGATRWRDLLGDVWTGCFAVTSSCEDPAAALRWVDALYGEEGALLAYAGIEGEDYAWNADGTWSFKVTNTRTINDIRANVLMYTGAAMPGLYPSDFIAKVASPVDQHVFEQNERVHAVSEQVVPAHALNAADQQRANELTAVLGGLVDKGIARFATGEVELNDETYAAWLAELKAAGSDELAALYGGIR